jgi:hypothetical protein
VTPSSWKHAVIKAVPLSFKEFTTCIRICEKNVWPLNVVAVQSHMNAVYTFLTHFSSIHFNIILPSTHMSSKWSRFFLFPDTHTLHGVSPVKGGSCMSQRVPSLC